MNFRVWRGGVRTRRTEQSILVDRRRPWLQRPRGITRRPRRAGARRRGFALAKQALLRPVRAGFADRICFGCSSALAGGAEIQRLFDGQAPPPRDLVLCWNSPSNASYKRSREGPRLCANTHVSRPGGTVNQRLLYNRNARIQTGRPDAFGNIVNAAMSKTLKRALRKERAAGPENARAGGRAISVANGRGRPKFPAGEAGWNGRRRYRLVLRLRQRPSDEPASRGHRLPR